MSRMETASRLVIVIPAYNEAENLEAVLTAWHDVLVRHGDSASVLLVLDDGSTDQTWAILQRLSAQLPRLEAHTRDNRGHGATIREGYALALARDADFIFQTDSDGQTLPEEFELLWRRRMDYSALIGQRVKRGDGFSRVIVANVLKILILLVFQVLIPDANTPFRLIQRDALSKCLPRIPDQFFLTNVLLTVLLKKNQERIKFVPITFRPRQGGQNSIHLRRMIHIGCQAVRDFAAIRRSL